MNDKELKDIWKNVEKEAFITGWDFSHIEGKYEEEDHFPWNYADEISNVLYSDKKLLDIDTGGGEFLLSLGHPFDKTSATEGYAPNVELCKKRLIPLGIDFRELTDYKNSGFENGEFDVVINRHGDFDAKELYRIIKPGGYFITQQVGEDNDRDIVRFLMPDNPKPFPGHNLKNNVKKLTDVGFTVIKAEECFSPIRFFDTCALVWFAKIIEWEFDGFSVEKCFDKLLSVEKIIREKGSFNGTTHRFFIKAKKAEK